MMQLMRSVAAPIALLVLAIGSTDGLLVAGGAQRGAACSLSARCGVPLAEQQQQEEEEEEGGGGGGGLGGFGLPSFEMPKLEIPKLLPSFLPTEGGGAAGGSGEGADSEKKNPGLDLAGLVQLVGMGAGAPMLGDLKKVNFGKSEAEGGAALQFELEANNFEDEKGNIKSGAYRDEGWVDEDAPDPMAFLGKLFGGGK